MTFSELAKTRFSVRKYLDRPVEDGKIRQILEVVRTAPSAVNYQPYFFIVVRESGLRDMIMATYARDWIKSAPVVIVACGDHSRAWHRKDGKDHCDIDAAIAIDHLTLAASELGLGTCWVCNFDTKACAEILGLPQDTEPVALIPLGYPESEPDTGRHEVKRRPFDEIVMWDGYRGPSGSD